MNTNVIAAILNTQTQRAGQVIGLLNNREISSPGKTPSNITTVNETQVNLIREGKQSELVGGRDKGRRCKAGQELQNKTGNDTGSTRRAEWLT